MNGGLLPYGTPGTLERQRPNVLLLHLQTLYGGWTSPR
jgi:hypothetical protein